MPYKKKYVKKRPVYGRKKKYAMRKRTYAKKKSSIPFTITKNCVLLYKNTSATLTPGTVYGSQRFRLNSCFDFDYDNNFGNKQPLFYDALLNEGGPYRSFRVNAWKISFKVVNTSTIPITVYWQNGSLNSISDADTQVEIQNMPRVKSLQLTGSGGSKSIGYLRAYGTVRGVIGRRPDDVFEGNYNASPSQLVNGTLGYMATDGVSTLAQLVVEVSCVQYVTLFNRDALVS